MPKTVDLKFGISLIDLMDLGKVQRTGAYIIHAEDLTIIETSASPSIPYLLKGLKELGVNPADVKNIIVTHIHLDHAGGVGLLLESCPNAKVYVHPKGERHLADPSRLILGAKAVYGDEFDKLFDPILPIPEDRLISMKDGETLQIGENRILTFLDSPGHAKHHFSIHDSFSNGIFTGDTIGVFYPQLFEKGTELYLPSTSPNQFDPDAMLQSAEKIESLGVDRIYFGHYGMSVHPDHAFEQLRFWLPKFMAAGKKVWNENGEASTEEKAEILFKSLFELVSNYLEEKKVTLEQDITEILQLDLRVGSMGNIDYLDKSKQNV